MAILVNFIYYAIRVACFAALAFGGIVLGKKYRKKKDLQNSN